MFCWLEKHWTPMSSCCLLCRSSDALQCYLIDLSNYNEIPIHGWNILTEPDIYLVGVCHWPPSRTPSRTSCRAFFHCHRPYNTITALIECWNVLAINRLIRYEISWSESSLTTDDKGVKVRLLFESCVEKTSYWLPSLHFPVIAQWETETQLNSSSGLERWVVGLEAQW